MTTPDRAEIRALEETTFRSWPALAEEELGGWRLRFAEGYTKRANSVNVLDPDPRDVDRRIAAAEGRYRAVGLAPIFRLTPLAEPDLDARLARRGYAAVEPSLVMVAAMPQWCRRHPGVAIVEGDDPVWRREQALAADLSAPRADTQRRMLGRVEGRVAYARMVHGDRAAQGFGIGVVDRGRAGFFDILVGEGARRRGLGRRLMEGLIAWARDDAGAASLWIQVVEANGPARALYEGLGFRALYPYHYRVAP